MTYLHFLPEVSADKADLRVTTWAARVPAAALFISVITMLELELGVLLVQRRDAEHGALLRRWLDERALPAFEGRILAVDTAVARRCARLHVPDPRAERGALIAATTLVHGMTLVTRKAADFEPMRVEVLNPWAAQQQAAHRRPARIAAAAQMPGSTGANAAGDFRLLGIRRWPAIRVRDQPPLSCFTSAAPVSSSS